MRRAPRGREEKKPVVREQIVLFRVGGITYGVGVRGLWEVLSPEGISGLPTPPYQVCTALAYRGKRLPLLRLAALFGDAANSVPSGARVLLTQGQGCALGLLVDEVLGVIEVEPHVIAAMPARASALSPAIFRGLFARDDQVIIVLNEDGLSSMPEVVRFSAG